MPGAGCLTSRASIVSRFDTRKCVLAAAAAAGVPACAVRQRTFRTLHTGLRVRKRPSTSAKIVAVLGTVGSKVTVNCFTHGSTVFGNNVWYHIVKPHNGFVAGFYLGTGGDPAAGIRHC